jgi:hypothetical protein
MEPNTVIAPGLEVQSENIRGNTDWDYVNGCTAPGARFIKRKISRTLF